MDSLLFPRLMDLSKLLLPLVFPGLWWLRSCSCHVWLRQGKRLTDFGGGHCDVVPHVRLPVQQFSQRDLPIVHIDVELPLQICVPIDEVPAKAGDL